MVTGETPQSFSLLYPSVQTPGPVSKLQPADVWSKKPCLLPMPPPPPPECVYSCVSVGPAGRCPPAPGLRPAVQQPCRRAAPPIRQLTSPAGRKTTRRCGKCPLLLPPLPVLRRRHRRQMSRFTPEVLRACVTVRGPGRHLLASPSPRHRCHPSLPPPAGHNPPTGRRNSPLPPHLLPPPSSSSSPPPPSSLLLLLLLFLLPFSKKIYAGETGQGI